VEEKICSFEKKKNQHTNQLCDTERALGSFKEDWRNY